MKTLYDYRCNDCQEIFEIRHAIDFEGIVKCPICQSGDTSKLIIMPAVKIDWHSFLGTDYTPQEQLKRRWRGPVNKERQHGQSAVC